MATEYTGYWRLIYDWQTLIAGALAVLAAVVAAWPVWRQLRSLRLQSAVVIRDALISRVALVEVRRAGMPQQMKSITENFFRELGFEEYNDEPDISSEWAHSAEQDVGGVVDFLTAHQETSLDGILVDDARKTVIQRARAFAECLSDIHTPDSVELDVPELDLTREQIAGTIERAKRARKELVNCISGVREAANRLDSAFGDTLRELRGRIRQMDAQVGSG